MIVTLNEVQRTCQKALSAAGAPPGLDDDGANAAAWLESRGLPALAGLAAALDRWAGDPAAGSVAETAPRAFDAGGRSAVFAGPGLVDMAVAAAGSGGLARIEPARIEIAALRDPRFLVPAAASLVCFGWAIGVFWAGGEATADPVSGVALHGDWAAGLDGPFDVVVQCRRAGQGAARHGTFDCALALAHDADDLEARHRAALASGLTVEDAPWRKIVRYAHRALVPASAESRARGAGATSSDNE